MGRERTGCGLPCGFNFWGQGRELQCSRRVRCCDPGFGACRQHKHTWRGAAVHRVQPDCRRSSACVCWERRRCHGQPAERNAAGGCAGLGAGR